MRLLLSALTLFALLLAGLAGFWWLGGPDTQRWLARQALELALERAVQVDGTLEVEIGAEPLLRLSGLRIDNPPWAENRAQVEIAQAEVRIALLPLLRGVLVLPLVSLQGVTVALETAADGRQSWQSDGAPAAFRMPSFDRLSLSDMTVTHDDRRDGRRTRVHVASLDQQRDDASGAMRLEGHGDINGEAFEIVGTTGRLGETSDAITLDLAIRLPAIDAKLAGTIAGSDLDLRLEARCPSLLAAAAAWDLSLPLDARIAVDARLSGSFAAPAFEEIAAAIQGPGDSRLAITGTLQVATAEGLRLESFDLSSTIAVPDPSSLAGPFGLDASWLGASQGSAELALTDRRMAARRLEIDAGRLGALRLEGDGGIGTFAIDGTLHLAPDIAFVARATQSAPALALIDPDIPELGPIRATGRFVGDDERYRLDQLVVDLGPPSQAVISARGGIGDLIDFEQVQLEAGFDLATTDLLAFLGVPGGPDIGRLAGRFELSDADGSLGIEHLEATIKETHLLALSLEGIFDDLENRDEITAQASLDVPNLASLAEAFGADGAPMQRLRFDGKLSGGDQRFDADGSATLGETRFDGVLAADLRGARPSFRGRLHSPHVRLVDLGLISAAGPPAKASVVANRRLFGAEPIPLEGLRKLDLDLDVQLDGIEGVALAIGHTKAHVTLTDGRLQLAPWEFDVVGGHAKVNAEVDVREPAPQWRLEAEADDVELGNVWRELQTEVPVRGELDLILDLHASGRAPRDLASSLSGDLSLALQRGQIRSRLFGLTTMNPVRWLVAQSTRRGYSRISCFVARFKADQGVADLQALVLDTPSVIATGEGQIDFARETLELRIRPSAKDRRLVELATPFVIRGSLADPAVEASATGATARAVGRVVVGPVNLLGALLPFIGGNGRDQDNPCLNLRAPGAPQR